MFGPNQAARMDDGDRTSGRMVRYTCSVEQGSAGSGSIVRRGERRLSKGLDSMSVNKR